jgi:hypothetical protein
MFKNIILLLILTLFTNDIYILLAKPYKGAEYRTKKSFLYGRFEVSYIPANREGVVSSFFTYHDPDSISADWNEIDIEFVGRYSNIVQFNTITPGQKFHIRSNFVEFDPYISFNTYAFEWTPEYVAWFINGEEVYRQTGEHVSTLQYPQKLMMNIWNPVYTNWVGTWNDNALPAFSYYDWISYSSYTPGNGNYGTGNNFTNEWQDELDFWDDDRWEMATHTFGGNQCDFLPANVVFDDGKMILCLTNNTDTGYVDIIKPEVKWARENFDNSITVKFSEEISKIPAETEGNYLLSGVEITDAILSTDKMSVNIFTNNYNKEINYNLIVLNITDDNPVPNTINLRGTTIQKSNELEFPVKINVGGESFEDYLGDQEWGEDVEYGYWAGDVHYWGQVTDILNTEDDEVYKSERVGLTTYKIRVPNGLYKFSLLFAKNDNDIVGDRIFDIVAENILIQNDVDIVFLAGKNTAYKIESEVFVSDEIIDLYFPEEVDSAFVNGIIVDQISTDVEGTNSKNINKEFKLNQNYPNPFNPKTNISYSIEKKGRIQLEVFDVIGNKIETLVNEFKEPGNHEANFYSTSLSSGVYFYTLSIDGNRIATKKMALLK